MSFSAARLTCFALLSALEDDMRSLISDVLGEVAVQTALSDELAERAQRRRAKDGLPRAMTLPGLLAYLDFADSWEILRANSSSLREQTFSSLNFIKPSFERIVAIRNRVAHTRPMEIEDSAVMVDATKGMVSSNVQDWPVLSTTLQKLTEDPSFVLGLTVNLPHDPDPAPQHNLPIPDFDETGFFGRRDQLRRIKRLIKGAYPVVSILGDGGIGKTSIALKAVYELLEDPQSPFEAYVWVTAKATILTSTEIRRISGAIESSLGLFTEALNQLGPDAVDDPVEELLHYLESFKILLILDNMETVLDPRLRDFLLELPLGSKVLVTSRVGLGIENPVRLEPLTLDDSIKLIRALSRIRDVGLLKSLPQTSIESIAQQMGGHPTYIKWFVAGVQAGRRPEELLNDKSMLLEYCMSNVYDHLGDGARSLMDVMQVLPGLRNQAELAFLAEASAREVQSFLLELITTNFVQMTSQMAGDSLDTAYHLSEFAAEYLSYHHPVEEHVRNRLLLKRKELVDLGNSIAAVSSSNPYSKDAVNIRANGDIHVAKMLRDALMRSRDDPNSALAQCREVQLLAPNYYEGWRVEGDIRANIRDHAGAIAAFDRALELAPESAAVAYHYGSFLLDEAVDAGRALHILQEGAKNDPLSIEISGQIAWAHYLLGNHSEAVAVCRHVVSMKGASYSDKSVSLIIALRSGFAGVSAATDVEEYDDAAELLEQCVELVELVDSTIVQFEVYDRITQLVRVCSQLSRNSEDYIARKAKQFQVRFQEKQQSSRLVEVDRFLGTVKSFLSDKGFGFIRCGQKDYFFHYKDLTDGNSLDRLESGLTVGFDAYPDSPRGPRAESVAVLF